MRASVTVNMHMPDGPLRVAHHDDHGRWSTIHCGDSPAETRLFMNTAGQCDELIAAAQAAKAHILGGAS